MDLVDLAIFKAVAEEGGIVRAARKLHRVPSSVTSRIQQLEASVARSSSFAASSACISRRAERCCLAYADRLLDLAEEARGTPLVDGPPRGDPETWCAREHDSEPLARHLLRVPRGFPDVADRADDGHQRRAASPRWPTGDWTRLSCVAPNRRGCPTGRLQGRLEC